MPSAKHRFNESLTLLSDPSTIVFGVFCTINPILPSVIISYSLHMASDVKLDITLATNNSPIRNIFLIRGNAGGRAGKNKVVWDGTNTAGLKVDRGRYQLRFVVNQMPDPSVYFIEF